MEQHKPQPTPPIVLSFAASDPSGGAGIQADLMTLSAMGCHALSVITALTVQDTIGVESVLAIDAEWVDDQARALLEDMRVSAFKIGLLGSVENVAVIAEILADYPDVPVVLDPVLASGRGDEFADEEMLDAMRDLLLPQVTVLTPNSHEARRLSEAEVEVAGDEDCEIPGEMRSQVQDEGEEARAKIDEHEDGDEGSEGDDEALQLVACARRLLGYGSAYVLITGTHENTTQVINSLYDEQGLVCSDAWDRLPGSYHGSGCTLASAIAANLAHGLPVVEAVRDAQDYTWQALAAGFRPGMGQYVPDRFFWARAAGADDGGDDEQN